MKKTLAIILTLAMMVAMLAGCGSSNNGGTTMHMKEMCKAAEV